MEDRVLMIDDVKYEGKITPLAIFGVLDGHNGHVCVDFVFNNMISSMSRVLGKGESMTDELALTQAFGSLDKQFLEMALQTHHSNMGEGAHCETSGSCATIACVRSNKCTIGWVGDCRAVLCFEDGSVRQMTEDHRPTSNKREEERILAAGGWIANKRVNGLIAITRSIGDIEFKTLKTESWEKAFSADLLISEPGITTFDITPSTRFIYIFIYVYVYVYMYIYI
jgi:serine/threonine protein phosphatase PrpC